MRNQLLILFALVFCTQFMRAQNAKISTVEFNKVAQPCVSAEYNLPADMVDGAFKKKLADAKLGTGSKASDGFKVYKGVVIPEITKEKMDIYYKVEDKKPTALLYMMISKGYDNFMKMEQDSIALTNSMAYLDKFLKEATTFHLNNEIVKQNDVIKDVEKKGRNAAKDGESLLKQKANLESDISENSIAAGALKTEMETQQRALELVRSKTATLDEMKALKKEATKQENLTRKATKKYDIAVKEGADLKEELAKKEKDLIDNETDQVTIRASLETERAKLQDIKDQLNALR